MIPLCPKIIGSKDGSINAAGSQSHDVFNVQYMSRFSEFPVEDECTQKADLAFSTGFLRMLNLVDMVGGQYNWKRKVGRLLRRNAAYPRSTISHGGPRRNILVV
jgi:hypothetical protein